MLLSHRELQASHHQTIRREERLENAGHILLHLNTHHTPVNKNLQDKVYNRGMEEAPENGKEVLHSACAR
jgi:hypothetical protein